MYHAVVHTTRGSVDFEFCKLEEWERFFDEAFLREIFEEKLRHIEDEDLREAHRFHFEPAEVSHVVFYTLSGRRFYPEELKKALGVDIDKEGTVTLKIGERVVVVSDNRTSFMVRAPDFLEKEKKFEKWWLSISM